VQLLVLDENRGKVYWPMLELRQRINSNEKRCG